MDTTITKETIGIEEKVAFLQLPSAYPFPVTEVQIKETHMSWVFLTETIVYKLKKPVKYRFFDHRTLESRMKNSVEEIRLNRQLAKDIYIGVVPLVTNERKKLELEGKGEIIDWLVKMKRIPEKNMLDYTIEHHCIDEIQLQNTAALLAEFYKISLPVDISTAQYIKRLESEIFSNYNELTKPLYELPLTLLRELTAGQMAFISANHSMIEKRTREKRIIDAHGDLRPEHICLGPYSAIIDRLEFCKDLRALDIAEELSFLAMECEIMGNMHVGHVFFDRYKAINNDNIPQSLINFYKIKRACLRAYLVARHIEEQQYKKDPKWLLKANAYLKLAERIHQKYAM